MIILKKIPYGYSNYKELILDNCFYIDKTMYLEKLESLSNKKVVYLKPRRFGKTLFTSMMGYYYDINSENEYDNLFKDTYIYNHPTKNKNNYYILKLDFSSITADNNEESIKESFTRKLCVALNDFLNKYDFSYDLPSDLQPNEILNYFLSYIKSE